MIRLIVLALLFGLFYSVVKAMIRSWSVASSATKKPTEPTTKPYRNLDIEDADFEEINRDKKSTGSPS